MFNLKFWNKGAEGQSQTAEIGKSAEVDNSASEKKGMALLKNAKFMESLNKNPNIDPSSIDIKNPDSVQELEKHFQAFEQKGRVHKKTEQFIKNHLSKELGVNLRESDLHDLEAFFDDALHNDPEYITKVANQFAEYEAMQKELAEQEKAVKKFKDKTETQNKLNVALEISGSGFWAMLGNDISGKLGMKGELDAKAEKFQLNINNISTELNDLKLSLENQTNTEDKINELKNKIAEFKLNLFTQVDADEKIAKYAARKATHQLRDRINNFDVRLSDKKALDELVKTKEQLGKMDQFDQNLKDEYFSGFANGAEIDRLIEAIDTKLEESLAKEVLSIVQIVEKTTSYTQMEKGLEGLLAMQKVGARERDEVKEFIKERLEHERDKANLQASSVIFINTYIQNHLGGI